MEESILKSIKGVLNLENDYTAFDNDLILHINSVFSTLTQLGIGPSDGFFIQDDTSKWGDFLGSDNRFNAVRTYVSLRVRRLFDPPETSFHLQAIEEQIKELEWRLNVAREERDYP